jgi:type I restriction enzyme S subunit
MIPEDWELKTLESLTSEIGDGIHSTPQYVKISDFFFVNGNNLFGNEIKIFDETKCVSEEEYHKYKTNLDEGTILLSINGTIGNIAIFNGEKIILGKSAAYINIRHSINRIFIYYSLQNKTTKEFFKNELTGSTINNLSLKSIRNIPIPLPSTKSEQRAIASALSDVDDLITSLDQLIAKKRDIKQATMQRLLTGKTRLSGFTGDGSARLGDFFELNPNKSYLSDTDLVTFIRMEDVSESGRIINQNIMPLSSIKKGLTYFERNDVLVAKITPCFENGKGACLDTLETKSGFGSTEFHILRAKKNALPRYIFYQTQLPEFRNRLEAEMIGTAGQKRVPSRTIIDYPLPIFHSKDEQLAIATILSDMDAEIAALEQKRDKTRALKQGMMQELLTGKTRLI